MERTWLWPFQADSCREPAPVGACEGAGPGLGSRQRRAQLAQDTGGKEAWELLQREGVLKAHRQEARVWFLEPNTPEWCSDSFIFLID